MKPTKRSRCSKTRGSTLSSTRCKCGTFPTTTSTGPSLKNFGHKYVHIPEHFLREYDRLLMGGIWAQLDIRHDYVEEQKGKRSPFWIDSLKPIQLATFD